MALGTYLGLFCMIAAIPLVIQLIVCGIKKWKFDWLMWAVTAVTSLIGVLPLSMSFDRGTDTWGSRLLWMICFFAVPLLCGLAGVCLVEGLRAKKITVHRPFSRISSFIIAIVGSLVLGGVGQILYDMGGSETVTTSGTKDVILLLDGSSSMNGYKEPCVDAACVLVDSLDEDCRVQVVSFAAKVLGETDFLYMDNSGKTTVKNFMQAIDVTGGTNFDAALDAAMDTLKDNKEGDRGQAVILLTDGDGPLSANVKKAYENGDVKLYTIRITGNTSNYGASELLDLVQATGGFDTQVSVTNGQVDADEMIQAFQNAFAGSQETESTDRLLLFNYFNVWTGTPTILLLLRLVIFGLYAILIAWVYYGPQKVGSMVIHGILGMGLAVFSWESRNTWADFIGFILCFQALFWSAYTVYRPADGVELTVGSTGIGSGAKEARQPKAGKTFGGKSVGKLGRKTKKEDAHV